MTLVGQFRDRRRPDRFVWLRGFSNMESRHEALEAFYDGPVWAAHRTEANNTMEDSDDVLLLKPARPELAFRIGSGTGTSSSDRKPSTVLAGIYEMPRPVDAWLVSQFERQVAPILQANGVQIVAVLMTESARNTFTRLPVRQGEHVLVWLGILQDPIVRRQGLTVSPVRSSGQSPRLVAGVGAHVTFEPGRRFEGRTRDKA